MRAGTTNHDIWEDKILQTNIAATLHSGWADRTGNLLPDLVFYMNLPFKNPKSTTFVSALNQCVLVTLPLLSAEYDAEDGGPKFCLELGCSATTPCRCKDCVCCSTCTANCECVGSTVDPDTVLQRLLLPEPCYSYR